LRDDDNVDSARARIPRVEIRPIIDDVVTTICGAGAS
jgi:hypothetical protein